MDLVLKVAHPPEEIVLWLIQEFQNIRWHQVLYLVVKQLHVVQVFAFLRFFGQAGTEKVKQLFFVFFELEFDQREAVVYVDGLVMLQVDRALDEKMRPVFRV